MSATRRRLAAGGAALAVCASSTAAPAQGKAAARADPAELEAALRSKFAAGDVLNWTARNLRRKRPSVIDVTTSLKTAGVDLNGATVVADFNNPNRSALTI